MLHDVSSKAAGFVRQHGRPKLWKVWRKWGGEGEERGDNGGGWGMPIALRVRVPVLSDSTVLT